MRVGQTRKRDIAEKPILLAARQVGAQAWAISCPGGPDALILFRGRFYAGEIKTGKGRLTKLQGAFPIWRTPDDMLRAIGAVQDQEPPSFPLRCK